VILTDLDVVKFTTDSTVAQISLFAGILLGFLKKRTEFSFHFFEDFF